MNVTTMGNSVDWVNVLCLFWLLFCWVGYARFAHYKAKKVVCLASVMHDLRLSWMRELLRRDMRVADASIIANLERNVSFMASTSILILAGLVTGLASTDDVFGLLSSMHLSAGVSPMDIQFKFLVLICIFIYSFFTFTWSLRQFGFASVIIGATPVLQEKDLTREQEERFAQHSGKIVDQASHTYNYGLRAYYFAMSTLAWFVHPLLFVAAVALVVIVLYMREFRSTALKVMSRVHDDWELLPGWNRKQDTE